MDQNLSILDSCQTKIETKTNTISTKIYFSEPRLIQKEKYISIELSEANSNCLVSGKPYLPVLTKEFEFEFGTKINSIDVTFSKPKIKHLSKPIELSPKIQTISTLSFSNPNYKKRYERYNLIH